MGDRIEDFWRAFCAAAGGESKAMAGVAAFGDSAAQQDELCRLVGSGRKCATASLALWYGPGRETAPRAGDLLVVLDGAGAARCVIEITSVFEARFCDADEAFAAAEGEGDGSLSYWLREHQRFFSAELAAEGLAFSPNVRVMFERFRLVWAPD